jgi:CheY-like chemotaxis protein
MLPRMDGFELYKHVKKIDDRIKVVFVTAAEINYEALNELSQVDQLDISDDEQQHYKAIEKEMKNEYTLLESRWK